MSNGREVANGLLLVVEVREVLEIRRKYRGVLVGKDLVHVERVDMG